jgi:hypothetical protein
LTPVLLQVLSGGPVLDISATVVKDELEEKNDEHSRMPAQAGAPTQGPDAKASGVDHEDEATTLWAKADLFSEDDFEEEEPLFREQSFTLEAGQEAGQARELVALEAGQARELSVDDGTATLIDKPPRDVSNQALPPANVPTTGDAPSSALERPADPNTGPVRLNDLQRARQAPAPDAMATAAPDAVATSIVEPLSPPPSSSDAPSEARPSERRSHTTPDPGPQQSRFKAEPTTVVHRSRLSCQCRMCGKKIEAPKPRRFRGSLTSAAGFRCDTCDNVFCAGHVIRVSSVIGSLFRGGVFRCQLCAVKKP